MINSTKFTIINDKLMLGTVCELLEIKANWTISTGKLHTLLHFHTQPINVVVYYGPNGET